MDIPFFLISCRLACKDKWNQFSQLSKKLIEEEFPQRKRKAMVSAMAVTGKEVIEAKYELLNAKFNKISWAVLYGLAGAIPGCDTPYLLERKIAY